MWKQILRLILLCACWLFAGNLQSYAQAPSAAWTLLALPDSSLRQDIMGNEMVIDLVDASVTDSIVTQRRQRLKGFGGWIAQRAAARYWQYYTDHKQKYVASSTRPYHIYDGVGDEMDINIFLMPHLPRYVRMVDTGFDIALRRPRSIDAFRFDTPPGFPVPEELKYEDRGYILVECEVTPPQQFMERLEHDFLPMREGVYVLDSMPHFGTKHPSFGLTGVWCMDCNHNCRPEIHPIEWLWWLDLSENRPGSPNAKSWMVALMVDASNRFQDWCSSPLSGEIAIPFSVPRTTSTMLVDMHQIAGDPIPNGRDLAFDEHTFQSGDTSFVIPYLPNTEAASKLDILMRTSSTWSPGGTHYWISNLELGPNGWTGYLHLSTTVQSLLALRVTIDSESR
jgi:hypothetical protein